MTKLEIYKQLLNKPIEERPQYKKVKKALDDSLSGIEEIDDERKLMAEIEIRMYFKPKLQWAAEEDSKWYLREINKLTKELIEQGLISEII